MNVSEKIAVFADKRVGLEITEFLVANFRDDIDVIFTTEHNDISKVALENKIETYLFVDNKDAISKISKNIRLGILAWWPKIISKELISVPKHGFINTHNSLLPNHRGKHPYFWAIVEQLPYGVTVHKVNENIDEGEILALREIEYGWCDTAGSIYEKSLSEITDLFKELYPKIRRGKVKGYPQGLDGSFHLASELDATSQIFLDKTYTARELLNLIRARTTNSDFPATYFFEGKDAYEIKISITKRKIH